MYKKSKHVSCLAIAACTLASPLFLGEEQSANACSDTTQATSPHPYGHIDGKGLKGILDSKTTALILDARTPKWDDGKRIPTAKLLPADSDTAKIIEVATNKDDLIVVYCGSSKCPLGPKLASRLKELGYKNVLEFSGGMKEWNKDLGYPVEQDPSITK